MHIKFTPLAIDHFPLLLKWLKQPHVKLWWDTDTEWDEALVAQKYALYMQGYALVEGVRKPIYAFVIEMDNVPIGYIQYYNKYDFPNHLAITDNYDLSGLPENLAGLDYYIGEEEYVGKGYAAKIVRQFLTEHVEKRYAACVVDPNPDNKVALRIYDKVGFKHVRSVSNSISLLLWESLATDNPIIIFGSARDKGDTWDAVQMVLDGKNIPIINLREIHFSGFDYTGSNHDDDFLPVMKNILNHNPIILATPVYWYSMSDIMKRFLDRWSDLLSEYKDMGRALRGKTIYVISSYAVHPEGKAGFEETFQQTCEYLGMHYGGAFTKYSGSRAPEVSATNLARAKSLHEKLFGCNTTSPS